MDLHSDHEQGFSDEEIDQLVKITEQPMQALMLLQRAGFPTQLLPPNPPSHLAYWTRVSDLLIEGVLEDGRQRILDVVCRTTHKSNPVLCRNQPPAAWRVLLMGASPKGTEPIRSDEELRRIWAHGIKVDHVPAARIEDLSRIRDKPHPHILHLSCHGRGQELVFDDGLGHPHSLHAAQEASTLDIYRRSLGIRLRAIVLNACRSGEAANALRGRADVIIAHAEEIEEHEAIEFTDALYGELAKRRYLPDVAARMAVAELANADATYRRLKEGIVILR